MSLVHSTGVRTPVNLGLQSQLPSLNARSGSGSSAASSRNADVFEARTAQASAARVSFPAGPRKAALIKAYNIAKRMGLVITATTNGVHTPGSYHYQGRAFDAAGTPKQMAKFFDRIAKMKSPTELFYDPKGAIKNGQRIPPIGGHSDHVHVAF